jgi:excisionase family DNA binding protein
MDNIITVKETAKMFHSSTATIYKMCRENQIPHFRVRGKILFNKDELMKWTKEQEADQEAANI